MRNSNNLEVKSLFCENLIYYRRKRRMTQQELGSTAEVHRTHISSLEQGGASPSLDTIIKLAGALKVDPWNLLYDRAKLSEVKRKNNYS